MTNWNCNVPAEVLAAAELVTEWTKKMNFRHWRIAGCASPTLTDDEIYGQMAANYRRSGDHISSPDVQWNYNMDACPRGVKCLLLNAGGVAVFGPLNGDSDFFRAWAPLPQRDKEEEKRRGFNC